MSNGRPQRIKTTSGTRTFVDLTYSYAGAGKDTSRIRTRTDDLTSRDGGKNTCPGSTTYTYDDASELTGRNGSTTGWSYDKLGNETAAAGNTPRTGETRTDHSQLSSITAGGKTYDLVHAGTSNHERTKLGPTWFHHTALDLASTTTNGVDTGSVREPAGTLNSTTTGGKSSSCYLTDATGKRTHTYAYGPTGLPRTAPTEAVPSRTATRAPVWIRRVCTRWATATTPPPSAASPGPTRRGRRPTPTSTRAATPSTTPTPLDWLPLLEKSPW